MDNLSFLRKLVGWSFVIIVLGNGALLYFYSAILSFAYFALAVSYLAFHAVKYCAECSNTYCPINRKSADYIFGLRQKPTTEERFSDINALRAAFPLMLLVAASLVFIFIWNIFAGLIMIAFIAVVWAAYSTTSCKYCTNECFNNKNQAYWDWKKGRS